MLAHLGMIPLANHHSRLVKKQLSNGGSVSCFGCLPMAPGPKKSVWTGHVILKPPIATTKPLKKHQNQGKTWQTSLICGPFVKNQAKLKLEFPSTYDKI